MASRPCALRTAPDGRSVASLYNGWIKLWDVPGTIEAEADDERLVASAEALTGLSIDARGEIDALAPAAWRERLESGDAGLLGRRRSIDDWHDRNAARAELLGPPETALWHLDRLGAVRPGDGVVRLRLARARESSGESSGAAGCAAARRLSPDEAVSTWLLHDAADRIRDAARAGRWPEAAAALDAFLDARRRRLRACPPRRGPRPAGSMVGGGRRPRRRRRRGAGEPLVRPFPRPDPARRRRPRRLPRRLRRVLAAADPDPDPIAANYLAWACAWGPMPSTTSSGRSAWSARLRVAFPDYRRYSLRTLGACLYRAGRYAEAIAAIEESIAFVQGRNCAGGLGVPGHGPPSARPARRRPALDGSLRRIPPARPAAPIPGMRSNMTCCAGKPPSALAVLPDLPDPVFAAP